VLCNHVFRGFKPAYAITPPMGDYDPPHVAGFDKEKARRLLAEAGFPGGKGFPRLKVLISSRETAATLAQAVQAMWRETLGIEVEIENKEWNAYLVATQELDYDIAYGGWIGDYLDPLSFLEMWTPGNGNNNTGWKNPAYDRLIAAASHELDTPRRFDLLRQAEAVLLEEVPATPVFYGTRTYLIHPDVKGWVPALLGVHRYQTLHLAP